MLTCSSFLEKPLLRKRKRYMDRCFPARFNLCTDAEFFIGQYRWGPKYAVYPLYSPYVSSAVFTTRREPVKAGLRKEMSGKNGAVITKSTSLETMLSWICRGIWRYWYLVYMNGYLYTWFWIYYVFYQINCVITPIRTLSVALMSSSHFLV